MAKKTIVIAVSYGFGGYGDFLFALKLADGLRSEYQKIFDDEHNDDRPDFKIVTQEAGRDCIQSVGGDKEFGVDVLTPEELDPNEIIMVIEGPVMETLRYETNLLRRLDRHCQSRTNIPMYIVPEYSMNSDYASYARRAKTLLSNFQYRGTIPTGIRANEKGIILSERLVKLESDEAYVATLDEKIKTTLLPEATSTMAKYRENTELFFQYSHDHYDTDDSMTAARRFLEVQRQWSKSSPKNQDVIMVGRNKGYNYAALKQQALHHMRTKLIDDGFSKIVFYNSDTGKEDVLYEDHTKPERVYRVIYATGMTHQSMISCSGLSEPLSGTTGDQSFGEGVSASKVMTYECLEHKKALFRSYKERIRHICENLNIDKTLQQKLIEAFRLLHQATSERNFNKLGTILKQEGVKAHLEQVSKVFQQQASVTQLTTVLTMPEDMLLSYATSLAQEDRTPDAETNTQQLAIERTLISRLITTSNWVSLARLMPRIQSSEMLENITINFLTEKHRDGKSLAYHMCKNSEADPSLHKAMILIFQKEVFKYEKDCKTSGNQARIKMFNSFVQLNSTFSAMDTSVNVDAFIGLLLLTTQNIANEYRFMSPRKGLFFGSRFYSHLEKALEHYDIRLKDITPEERQRYYKALADTVKTEPRFLGNDYILQSLSKEANITFPAVPPQIEEKTAIAYLENKRRLPPHSFKSQQSLYVMQQQLLGKGGWGTVHAARQYQRGPDGRLTSNIMVLKKMPKAHASIAQKEITMYKRANPKLEGECLTESNHIYIAMPFYPGAPLDSFLQNETGSDIEARKQMVDALLKDLAPIHRQDVIHCDIKPKNILWDPVRKKMHIVDFGCAEENNAVAKYTDLGNAKFAIEYMPPEYVTGSVNISKPMDIYSLTLTVAEILGADKTALVRRKLEAALTTPDISDPQKEAIRRAFTQLGSLDKALFSSDVNQCLDGNAYKTFIQAYSAQQYDFSPYVEAFGEDVVNMLNRMQTLEPGRRPSIEDIQKLFQQPNLDEQERMEI